MHDNIDKQRGIRETFLIPTFCLGFFVCCQEDLKTVFVGKKKIRKKKCIFELSSKQCSNSASLLGMFSLRWFMVRQFFCVGCKVGKLENHPWKLFFFKILIVES